MCPKGSVWSLCSYSVITSLRGKRYCFLKCPSASVTQEYIIKDIRWLRGPTAYTWWLLTVIFRISLLYPRICLISAWFASLMHCPDREQILVYIFSEFVSSFHPLLHVLTSAFSISVSSTPPLLNCVTNRKVLFIQSCSLRLFKLSALTSLA